MKILAWALLLLTMPSLTAAETLKIAVAANFAPVMEKIRAEYLRLYPALAIDIIPGSSGKLAAQILNGADFDLFISADTVYPGKLEKAGLALEKPRIYARGQLILVSIRGLPLSQGLSALTNAGVSRFALASPALSPYGKAAAEALTNAGLGAVMAKAVYTSDISQAMTAAMTSADAALTARSLLYTPAAGKCSQPGSCYTVVSQSLYSPLYQSMVILKNTPRAADARKLADFILSPAAQALIRKNGYPDPVPKP